MNYKSKTTKSMNNQNWQKGSTGKTALIIS